MAPHLRFLFFALSLSLLMLTIISCQLRNSSQSSHPASSPRVDDTVNSPCAHTDYPKLCISAIQCQLPIHEPLDPIMILKLAMRAILSNSKAARSVATAFFHDPKNKAAIGPLKDCQDLYSNMVDSLHSADVAVEARDKGTAGSMLSAVSTDIRTCNDGFDEMQQPNLMLMCDDLLAKLASICLSIAHTASLM